MNKFFIVFIALLALSATAFRLRQPSGGAGQGPPPSEGGAIPDECPFDEEDCAEIEEECGSPEDWDNGDDFMACVADTLDLDDHPEGGDDHPEIPEECPFDEATCDAIAEACGHPEDWENGEDFMDCVDDQLPDDDDDDRLQKRMQQMRRVQRNRRFQVRK